MKRPARDRITLLDVIDEVGAYVCTLAGLLMSQFYQAASESGSPELSLLFATQFSRLRIVLAAIAALYIVLRSEEKGDDYAGRRTHMKGRMARALCSGFTANGVVGLAGLMAGQQ